MAYSTTNPPSLVWETVGGGLRCFAYSSADAIATVAGANYFANGGDLGMQVNDVVFVANTAGNTTSIGKVSAVTAGAATIVALTAVV